MSDWYILDENNRLVKSNGIEYSEWIILDPSRKQVASRTLFAGKPYEATVSTVFLGLDHSWKSDEPKVFETLVFGGNLDGRCAGCGSYEKAKAQHDQMVYDVIERRAILYADQLLREDSKQEKQI